MANWSVDHIDDIRELEPVGECPIRPVRHHFGITAFGVNAWTAKAAGDRLINEHEEDPGNEELYIVTRGRAVFELDGERQEAGEGTLVFAAPSVKRTAFAEEPGTTVVAVGATTGKPYEPIGWELWAPVNPLFAAGEYAEAADRGLAVIEAHPGHRDLYFNVACCESLAARPADAIEHLRLAIDGSEQFRAMAAGDSDFDPIRDEPAFAGLVGR